MKLNQWRAFIDSEIARIPHKPGVYLLFQVENPLHAGHAKDLRKQLRMEKKHFPRATHFAVETGHASEGERRERARKLRSELHLVRAKTFAGTTRRDSQ